LLGFLTRDGWLLFAGRGLRGVTYGYVSVLLVTYLAELRASAAEAGVVFGLAILSGAVMNIAASRFADRIGRRRFLVIAGLSMVASGAALALTSSLAGALFAAALGGLTPTAMEVGPFLSVEQAVLPQASAAGREPDAYAWYNLIGSLSAAFGGLLVGLVAVFSGAFGGNVVAAYHVMFAAYAAAGLASCALAFALSPAVELQGRGAQEGRPRISPEGRRMIQKMTLLFAVDSFAGGMIIRAVTTLWFSVRFDPSLEALGLVFFGANALAALSYLTAAQLARQLGLIRTMVYTHIPSNVLLIAMAFSPTFEVGVVLFLARMSMSQMDVAPRQQFVVTVVAPSERTAAAGITNTARNLAQAGGPFVIGPVIALAAVGGPFILAGAIKIGYDLALLREFGSAKQAAPDS
jgi:MFS family permease